MTTRPTRLLVLGTGGTIAGAEPEGEAGRYRAGAVSIEALLASASGLGDRLALAAEQPFSTGSQHFTSGHWLTLARRIAAAADDSSIDGIVITHGTDTLEETAFALDLLAPRAKAVVLTGAMRPATAVSADGPANLRAACLVAADPGAAGCGPLVAFADRVWAASQVGKRQTQACDAFDAGEYEALATVAGAALHWRREPASTRDAASRRPTFPTIAGTRATSLPAVALVWQHPDCDPAVIDWYCQRGIRGIVLAATGAGTMPAAMRAALAGAVGRGCLVVRASRVANGPVLRDNEVDEADRDSTLGFVAAGRLGPLKARILVQCCLASGLGGQDADQAQALFDAYG